MADDSGAAPGSPVGQGWDGPGAGEAPGSAPRCAQSADPAAWFPATGDAERLAHALETCQACPLREPCLAFALETHQEWGIWGGTTPERRRTRL